LDKAASGFDISSSLDSAGDPNFACKNILKEIAYTVEVKSVDEPKPEDSKDAYL